MYAFSRRQSRRSGDRAQLRRQSAQTELLVWIQRRFQSFFTPIRQNDLFEADTDRYLREVILKHVSGRLKVAPEHTEDNVLKLMRKPSFNLFRDLNDRFHRICQQEGLRYQLIPYFISSHPGCTETDMKHLAEETRKLHFRLEQVQDLTPTPLTLSSVMFYTGENPYTGEKVYVARSQEEKRRQKSYFFTWKKSHVSR